MKHLVLLWMGLLLKASLFAQPKLKVTRLEGDFYVCTTYGTLSDGSVYPSNSMYVVTSKGVIMIDVPWDTTQTRPLLRQIEKRHHQKVMASFSTHFHADRTAGLNILKRYGVKTYSTAQTRQLCLEKNEQLADFVIPADTVFHFGNHSLQVYYPGPGHSADNIVIWFAREKILYGGCFVKSVEAPHLGNLSDADTVAWPASVQRVQQAFPGPRYIIPGHGSFTSTAALVHTARLLQQHAP